MWRKEENHMYPQKQTCVILSRSAPSSFMEEPSIASLFWKSLLDDFLIAILEKNHSELLEAVRLGGYKLLFGSFRGASGHNSCEHTNMENVRVHPDIFLMWYIYAHIIEALLVFFRSLAGKLISVVFKNYNSKFF